MKLVLQNKKGFSLIELMIVVAIIGILSAIGIPQYAKFQAKARQSEAKGHLTGIYSAESSFKSEWDGYTTNLVAVGYSASGSNLKYTAGFPAAACTTTGRNPGAPVEVAGNTQIHLATVNVGALAATFVAALTPAAAIAMIAPPATTVSCDETRFTAFAVGDPKNTPTAANADQWSINESKQVVNVQVGI